MDGVNGAGVNHQNSKSRRHAPGVWRRAELALTLVVAFCPLALGTVHLWAISIAASLAFCTLALTVWAAVRGGEPFLVPAPGKALVLVTLFIAFQLVPLPPFLLGLIAPHTRALFELVLAPLGHYPRWRPLSLDPAATARELAKAVTYVAVFLSAAQIARSRRARTRLMTLLGVVGIVVALIGFGHALWGASSLFGVFSYETAFPTLYTTFGNPNHLASLLALSATALLARVLTVRDRKIATLWAFGYLATGVGVFLTLSRGGIVAFVAAQAMLGVAVYLARRSEREGVALRARALVIPGVALVVLAVSAYIAWDALAQELASADSLDKLKKSKIELWPTFFPLLKAHWLTGVGRGAFESAYQRFQDPAFNTLFSSLSSTFTHPESLPFQWTSELGMPMGLFFLGACGWALLQALRRGPWDADHLACIFALAAIGLHDIVDFALEVGGLAVPAMVALALATLQQEGAPSFKRRSVLLLLPGVAVVTAVCLVWARGSLEVEAKALIQDYGRVSADQLAQKATAMAARHPADYFPHLLVAQAYASERPFQPEPVMAFANRAMYLNPALAQPHRMAALALRMTGRLTQAAVEYRLAYQLNDQSVPKEVTRVFKTTDEMEAALVGSEEAPGNAGDREKATVAGESALASLADELMAQQRYDAAEAVAQSATRRYGERLPALQRMARLAALRNQPEEEDRLGLRMSAIALDQPIGLHTRVEAALTKKNLDGALALLETEGLQRFPVNAEVLLSLARLRLWKGNTRGCREALKRLPADMDVGVRLMALGLEAGAAESDGQPSKAVNLLHTAVTLRPNDGGWRWQYATLLERVGRLDQALREAETAATLQASLKTETQHMKERVAARKKELETMRLWKDVSPAEKKDEAE